MKLADGISFTASAPMSEVMKSPLFSILYSTKQGCFMGELSLSSPVSLVLSNNALWIKPHLGNVFGFNELVSVETAP
jgi:hypothetical protein